MNEQDLGIQMHGPIVRGKASICNWELYFEFLDKNQCTRFIAKFMDLDQLCKIQYYVESGDSLNPDKHCVHIEDGCWAYNLTTIAKILEEVDYKDGKNDE
jgi:hypothetical protein